MRADFRYGAIKERYISRRMSNLASCLMVLHPLFQSRQKSGAMVSIQQVTSLCTGSHPNLKTSGIIHHEENSIPGTADESVGKDPQLLVLARSMKLAAVWCSTENPISRNDQGPDPAHARELVNPFRAKGAIHQLTSSRCCNCEPHAVKQLDQVTEPFQPN